MARKWSALAAGSALSGTEKFPGLDGSTNKTWLASQLATYITALIVGTAPATLDTLGEIADALADDANFAATITSALSLKAPLASPALTGAPTAPTAAGGTNTTQIATTAFVAAGFQPVDADLTAIAALSPSNDDVIQRKAGVWTNRTLAQFRQDLAPAIPSGRMMLPEGTGIGVAIGVAPGADSIRMFKATIRRAITISELRVRITTAAAGGNCQIALYADDPTTGAPTGAPLYASGALSTASTGLVGPTGLTLSIASPGDYWFAVLCDTLAATAVFAARSPLSNNQAERSGVTTDLNAFGGNANVAGQSKTHTYGTWPTLTGSYATDSLSDVVNASVPIVGFKV